MSQMIFTESREAWAEASPGSGQEFWARPGAGPRRSGTARSAWTLASWPPTWSPLMGDRARQADRP